MFCRGLSCAVARKIMNISFSGEFGEYRAVRSGDPFLGQHVIRTCPWGRLKKNIFLGFIRMGILLSLHMHIRLSVFALVAGKIRIGLGLRVY